MNNSDNQYFWYPQNKNQFKQEAYSNGKIIVEVYKQDELIDTFPRQVHKIWEQSIKNNLETMPQIRNKYAKGYTIKAFAQSYWLIPNNPTTYDAINAFKEYNIIDWGNANNNKINVNDIVFIYVSKPIQAIAIKARVIKANITNEELKNNDENYLYDNIRTLDNYFRLELVSFTDRKTLSLQKLQSNGLNGVPQGKQKLKGKLLEYILRNTFEDKRMNK